MSANSLLPEARRARLPEARRALASPPFLVRRLLSSFVFWWKEVTLKAMVELMKLPLPLAV